MPRDGCTCDSPQMVPAVDMNIARAFKGGNRFCRFCLGCARRKFCSANYWKNAAEKYAIPVGSKVPSPLEEGDASDIFACPNCNEPVEGEPEECPTCNVGYSFD